MIKICFMLDPPYVGGAERYVALIMDALDRERFEPSIIAKAGSGLDPWCEAFERRGIDVSRVPMNLPFRPLHVRTILEALWRHAPHIVHVNMPGPYTGQTGLLAPLARWAGAEAVVVTEHLPMVERLWKRALVKRLAFQWVDRVFTVSVANTRYLRDRQQVREEAIRVVYNGLPETFGADREARRDHERKRLGIAPDGVALVMVGSLIDRKGVRVLIEAFSATKAASSTLFLVGSGDQQAEYVELTARLGLTDRIRFLGELAVEEVETLLCAMDVLVLPSFMEGLPYVILEAMACSLPVVASNIHGVPEAAPHGESALLVPPGDSQALAGALDELVADAARRERMGRMGRRRFERLFTLDRHIARMQSHYLELLQGPERNSENRR